MGRILGLGYSGTLGPVPGTRQDAKSAKTPRREKRFYSSLFLALLATLASWRLLIAPSLELPVQVPLPRLRHAEDPEPPAGFVFHRVVIAGLVVPVPPDGGDALGPGGVDNAVQVRPLAQRQRHAVAVVRRAGRHADLRR